MSAEHLKEGPDTFPVIIRETR